MSIMKMEITEEINMMGIITEKVETIIIPKVSEYDHTSDSRTLRK